MCRWIVLLVLGGAVGTSLAAERAFDFSDDPLDATPAGFRSVLSGTGAPGDWRVILDELDTLFAPVSPKATTVAKRRVLAQLSQDPAANRYPMLLLDDGPWADFTLTTSFKIVSGQVEQMAGIAFRIQDTNNYYYIRASARGTNVSFFKMVDGNLSPADHQRSSVPIPVGVWQELMIEAKGTQFRALLNGKEVLLVTDVSGLNAYASGGIAFWTKSDSVSYFADTRLVFTTQETFAQMLVRQSKQKFPHLLGLRIYARPAPHVPPRVIASQDPLELGQPGGQAETAAIDKDMQYYGKIKGDAHVTLPLHDRNGDPIAAVRVILTSHWLQSEKNAVLRALPVVKYMESRVPTAADLNAH